MQPDKNPIDRVFHDKLKHYEVTPPAGAWDRIRGGGSGGSKPSPAGNKKLWLWALLLVGSMMVGGYYAFIIKEQSAALPPTGSVAMDTERGKETASVSAQQPSEISEQGEPVNRGGTEVASREEAAPSLDQSKEQSKQTKQTTHKKARPEPLPDTLPAPVPVIEAETEPDTGNRRYDRPPARVRVQVTLAPEREQQATQQAGDQERKPMGIRIIKNKKVEKVLNHVLYLKKGIGE